MSWWRAVWLVAQRELRERGRSKSYLFSTVFIVILLGGAFVVPALLQGGATTYQIGLVGEGGEDIVATAEAIALEEAGDDEPDAFETVAFDDLESAEAALENDDVDVVLVDGTELVTGPGGAFGGSAIESLLQRAAGTRRVQELVESGEEAAEVVRILTTDPLQMRRTAGADEEDEAVRGVVAFAGLVLMYAAILMYGSWMLSGVTEEKTNRVVEVLLSTLRPWHILGGKLIGIGLLGLAQLVVVVAAGLGAIYITNAVEIPAVPFDSVVALIGWFILGFLLYAILYGAAGSLVSRMEDAQNAVGPLTIVALVGYLFSFAALNDPDGTVAMVGTYIPFSAPYVAPIRLAIGDINALEMTAAVLITMVTIALLVRLAGRVYAGGLLRFGGRVKWREAYRSAE